MRLSLDEEQKLRSATKEEKEQERKLRTTAILESQFNRQLVLSGAGTGKTFLFTKKVERWMDAGIGANQIVVSSFINFIVEDLKKDLHSDCNVYTLHKFGKILLHRYLGSGQSLTNTVTNNFQITLGIDEDNFAEDILWVSNGDGLTQAKIKVELEKYFCSPSKHPAPQFLQEYFNLATFYDAITFDDVILRATEVMSKSPQVFPMEKVIVDEYQDFNDLEQQFVLKLFEESSGGIIAGDDDQSIYSSKHANPDGIIGIFNNPDWENSNLPFCSRSKSTAIVECAAAVCRKQRRDNRIDKSYLPLENGNEKVQVVALSQSATTRRNNFLIEAEYIAKQIDLEKVKNWHEKYPAYLILGRTNSHLKRIAEVLSERLGVEVGKKPYDIYRDEDVQILYSYIQLLKNQNNNLPFRRLLSLSTARDKKEQFTQAYTGSGFVNLTTSFVTGVKEKITVLQSVLQSTETTENKLIEIAKKLELNTGNENLIKFIDSIKDRETILEVLNQIDDITIEQKEQERISIVTSPIQCLTIWGSKGLKAETVFVLGLEEGYLPNKNSSPTDEEIRLLYVALTRAIEKLYLLRCKVRYDGVHSGNNGIKNASIFLQWLP
ncbi:MAG: ATP-dependent helicase, partial [Candidatus Taylorbacteria bacterium]|nr:ATP-dependent helicase [Candidatus Taylorbacteria bacterium]